MASDTETPSREGTFREQALAHYGEYCQNPMCNWTPANETQLHKLHVHHEEPLSEGGEDDIETVTVLCRDCHLDEHSESAFSHELVGRLTNALADALTHKADGFADRVARRVRLDSIFLCSGQPPGVNLPQQTTEYALVEGLFEGDHYDEYIVDPDQPYLRMCSCYTHSFGVHRAQNICTHVGATIVRQAIDIAYDRGEDIALDHVQSVGERLNDEAAQYIEKQNLVTDGVDTLDIEDRFSSGWADRAARQAKKMTKYGEEWRVFGGECEGCEVRLTSDGFRCSAACNQSWAAEDKWPCPGKLGAYILNEVGDAAFATPDLDVGMLFEVRSDFASAVEVGDYLAVRSVNDADHEIEFSVLHRDETVTLDYRTVTEAIIRDHITTARERDLTGWGIRVQRDVADVPVGLAPDLNEGWTMEAKKGFHPAVEQGDFLYVREQDDDERELVVERVTPDEAFGGEELRLPYDTVVSAIRAKYLMKGNLSDVAEIIATDVVYAYGKEKVAFSTPYEARSDFNELDWDDTKRSWNDPVDGKWSVNAETLDHVIDHLQDAGWAVYVPRDVRDELDENST